MGSTCVHCGCKHRFLTSTLTHHRRSGSTCMLCTAGSNRHRDCRNYSRMAHKPVDRQRCMQLTAGLQPYCRKPALKPSSSGFRYNTPNTDIFKNAKGRINTAKRPALQELAGDRPLGELLHLGIPTDPPVLATLAQRQVPLRRAAWFVRIHYAHRCTHPSCRSRHSRLRQPA